LDHKWKKWREKRDKLLSKASEMATQQVSNMKPKITPYTYAEARRGAWEGLARLADVGLVKQLDQIRANNKDNPILYYAVYRAIDLLLIHIDAQSQQADRDALNDYLNNGVIDKKSVAPWIEWTKDSMDGTFASLKFIEKRLETWFIPNADWLM